VTDDQRAVRQNRLLEAILSMIEITPTPEELARMTVAPVAAGARDFYLQGLGYLQDESKAENIDNAVTVFEQALKLDPKHDSETAYIGLANTYDRLGLAKQAEETYLKAISIRPRYWNRYNLGAFYYGKRRYADAERMFKEVVALHPDSWRGDSNLGGLFRGPCRPFSRPLLSASRRSAPLRHHVPRVSLRITVATLTFAVTALLHDYALIASSSRYF
jgi:tetratricopeptide (TPR) repeat protein